MKAKFISENINFERGQDPKYAMNIGYSREIAEMYKTIVKEVQLPRNVNLQSGFSKEIIEIIPDRFRLRSGWGNFHNLFPMLTAKEFEKAKLITLKYFNLLRNDFKITIT